MMLTRTFASSTPDPSINSFLIKPEDTIMQVRHRWDPSDAPVRYATLFPFTFRPNMLPPSFKVQFTNGLGSG